MWKVEGTRLEVEPAELLDARVLRVRWTILRGFLDYLSIFGPQWSPAGPQDCVNYWPPARAGLGRRSEEDVRGMYTRTCKAVPTK